MLRGMVFIGTSKLTKVLMVLMGCVGLSGFRIALSLSLWVVYFSKKSNIPKTENPPTERGSVGEIIPTEFPHFNVTGIFMELDLHS